MRAGGTASAPTVLTQEIGVISCAPPTNDAMEVQKRLESGAPSATSCSGSFAGWVACRRLRECLGAVVCRV